MDQILSSFYPNVRTTNHLIPKIFDHVSLVHVHSPRENWTQEQSSVFLWDIPQLKMAIIVTIHHPKFFVSVDVTFNESESYFPAPYLQGKNSIEKDKDRDSYFIDPFLIDLPKVSSPIFVPLSLSLNLSHHPLSLLLRIEWLTKCTQGRKL